MNTVSPVLLVAATTSFATSAVFAETSVTVFPKETVGPVKVMNAVNNGPKKLPVDGGQFRSNFAAFSAARIPYVRIHDANYCADYGAPHTVDITAVFPNFDKDVNDPKSYDFKCTDGYLASIVEAGSKVFFRLGQSIEHNPVKYGILPPKDFQKWAAICEHIVRHYNEGWADGFRYGIEYWEIWNEPDNAKDDDPLYKKNTWGGTEEQFVVFFETAARHLKAKFPKLKIGGPAFCWDLGYWERFVARLEKDRVPLDFFSYHCYCQNPLVLEGVAKRVRAMLDKHGFKKTETNLNEWNYVRDWQAGWVYSLEVESGKKAMKGAAFVASCMAVGQASPLDMLMYYDARIGTTMNGMFHPVSLEPNKAYYPFYCWAKLADLGTETRTVVRDDESVRKDKSDLFINREVWAVAARSADAKRNGLFVVRYNDDDNVCHYRAVTLRLKDDAFATPLYAFVTDDFRTYTEFPLTVKKDGSATLMLAPNAFAYVSW